jgi:lysophospholipase L1-like esterase
MTSIRTFVAGIFLCGALAATAIPAQGGERTSYRFNFGAPAAPGGISIWPTNFYSDAIGYGFESGSKVITAGGCVASTNTFYFSIKLPEGNYRVTVTLGSKFGSSTTTIKAELRRLMLYHIQIAAGQFVTRSFIVNVRTPKIAGDGEVRLKPREKGLERWAWDDKLTLEFNDTHPCIRSLAVEKVNVPTVFILGDSTVCDQPVEPWASWGQMLPVFFKPKIAVSNQAESGETLADSIGRGRFAKVFSMMKPGDYLFMQFGHNDMKNKSPDARAQYVADYKKVIAETRAKGATPVLVTSMEREAGVEYPTLEGYPEMVRVVAWEEHCPMIDLNTMSLVFYHALGDNLSKIFVPHQGTHFDNYGAYELAKCIVVGIQQDHLPLAKYVVNSFKGFNPAHPDPLSTFYMPASSRYSMVKPPGN